MVAKHQQFARDASQYSEGSSSGGSIHTGHRHNEGYAGSGWPQRQPQEEYRQPQQSHPQQYLSHPGPSRQTMDSSGMHANEDEQSLEWEEASAAQSGNQDGQSANKGGAVRVSKACVVCSLKKRRCDGGKPQCKVCEVLGTPCSYESRGLKRGPPKGFRAGPKESARAKMLRTLETTIRDLTLHMGQEETGREIARVSGERGIVLDRLLTMNESPGKRIKRETSAPVLFSEGQTRLEAEDDDEVLGISDQGTLRHIGSSSGIQLLQQQQHNPALPRPSHTSPHSRHLPSPSETATGRFRFSPRTTHPPIHLPSIALSRAHGGSPSSHSGTLHSSSSPLGQHARANSSSTSDERGGVSQTMNRKLFQQYWNRYHPIWPILYKPALEEISVDLLPSTLDQALVYSIYAIAVCVANPSLDSQLEAELCEPGAGDAFAQRAEHFLFQHRAMPTPSFASIQSCFLLACYHQGAGQLSKAYLLSSLANSMALDLGLHRHLHQYEHDLIERESRSRLIHCIYILSTLLSAEMGRPPVLRSKDIDVPPMSENERDEMEKDQEGRQLYSASLLNCSRRLFAIVETVLVQVHSFRRKAALRRAGSEGIRTVVEEIDQSLEAWRTSVPAYLRLPEDRVGESPARDSLPSVVAVQIWYYTAKILLHRPFIPQDEGVSLSQLLNDAYHQKCTQAADELFKMLVALAKASGVDSLSTDFAYIIFTVAVMFVFNARLEQTSIASAESSPSLVTIPGHEAPQPVAQYVRKLSFDAKRQFSMCKDWLRKLSDRWPAASAHKQLLDGFSNIGEGVVGGETNQMLGRRPSLANGSLIPAGKAEWSSEVARWQTGNGTGGDRPPSRSFASSGASPFPNPNPFNPTPFFLAASQASEALGMQVPMPINTTIGNNGPGELGPLSMPPQQQSLNAYFEFAPNIFDMENVYWNETATRLTPFLGPRDGAAAMSQQANALPPLSSADDFAQGSLRTARNGEEGETGPQSGPTSNNANGFTNPLPFTPRTLGAIASLNQYSNLATSMGPPQLPTSQTTSEGPTGSMPMGPPMHLPSTMRSAEATAGSTTSSKSDGVVDTLGNSPGLQMLAHAVTSGAGQGSTTASSTTANGGPASGFTSFHPSPARTGNGGQHANPSISPFSFHQEPSAPEWGDVISMLQLPPAFIQ